MGQRVSLGSNDKGLAYGDIRLNKWVVFSSGKAATGQQNFYARRRGRIMSGWGTNQGAARFDKIIQEWEIFLAPEKGFARFLRFMTSQLTGSLVYFATGKGLAEYDTRFEKWRLLRNGEGILSDEIRFIHPTTEYLWVVYRPVE